MTKGNAIMVTEVGQHQMWAAQYYKYSKPRTLLTSGGLGTMGYGLGAAIGAQTANPDRTVVNIAGDGCFRMNMNELATASRRKASSYRGYNKQPCTWNGTPVADSFTRSITRQPYSMMGWIM